MNRGIIGRGVGSYRIFYNHLYIIYLGEYAVGRRILL